MGEALLQHKGSMHEDLLFTLLWQFVLKRLKVMINRFSWLSRSFHGVSSTQVEEDEKTSSSTFILSDFSQWLPVANGQPRGCDQCAQPLDAEHSAGVAGSKA